MARNLSRPKPRLRSLGEQLYSLKRMVPAFNPDHALLWAGTYATNVPPGYDGFIAVPLLNNFGFLRIPAANEAWTKKTGWALHTSISGLRGEHNKHRADDFVISDQTLAGFKKLDAQQEVLNDRFDENRLRVFPVRFSEEPEPKLAEGEFHLDLSSLIWLLASHWKWRSLEGGLLFRCLGEKHASHASILVGYQHLERVLSVHTAPKSEGLVIIGKTQF